MLSYICCCLLLLVDACSLRCVVYGLLFAFLLFAMCSSVRVVCCLFACLFVAYLSVLVVCSLFVVVLFCVFLFFLVLLRYLWFVC